MAYFYPLLLYLGCGGAVVLPATSLIPGLRRVRKALPVAWVTGFTLLWLLTPTAGQWVLSVWTPTRVTGGWLVLDVEPAAWWGVLLISVAFSGLLWTSLAEDAQDSLATGALLAIIITVTWLTLTSGSVLMTLAMWAVFDVGWLAVYLVGDTRSERAIWAAAVSGLASLLLWAISLFLLREGSSGLWWLMRPSPPILTLLRLAGLIRVGFYPFQVIHKQMPGRSPTLTLVSMMNPLMGVALLYRLLRLPGAPVVPIVTPLWGCASVLWLGLKAFGRSDQQRVLATSYGVLVAIVTGALVSHRPDLLLLGAGIWCVGVALLLVARRHHPRTFFLSWPTVIGVGFLLGVPPSPLQSLYVGAFGALPWTGRVMLLVGLGLLAASLLSSFVARAECRAGSPFPRRWIGLAVGLVVLCVGLFVSAFRAPPQVPPLPFLLWIGAVASGGALLLWGGRLRVAWAQKAILIDLLDMQWLYRALWEGAENILGILRVTAEVVEGSGSILWSVLILLLVLVIVGGR